ncbi:MAG TPA: PIG-L deacetylase family protein [Trueperaceae bacterium]|nr:PIG-L deacetylase family protein [Trueperaceae bacterium]
MTDVLLIVPHPDDEVFGCGALFARMAAHGRRVATLTLTRGRAGRSLDLCAREDVPAVREAELRGSLAALGVEDVTVFDYRDFVPDADRGIAPDPGLQAVPEADILPRIVEVVERVAPRVLLTFPPNGSNGHPDHVTAHRLALKAADAASGTIERVYYFAGDAPHGGPARPGFLSPDAVREAYLPPTHVVEAGPFLEAKLRAMAQHRTQALSVLNFMERFTRRLFVESFHRARPEAPAGEGPRTVSWL